MLRCYHLLELCCREIGEYKRYTKLSQLANLMQRDNSSTSVWCIWAENEVLAKFALKTRSKLSKIITVGLPLYLWWNRSTICVWDEVNDLQVSRLNTWAYSIWKLLRNYCYLSLETVKCLFISINSVFACYCNICMKNHKTRSPTIV